MNDLAQEKNSQPLPQIRQNYGLRLPNDRFCQLQSNFVYDDLPSTSNNNEDEDDELRQRNVCLNIFWHLHIKVKYKNN